MAQTYNCDWADAKRLNVVEFMNVIAYASDKRDEDKRQLEEWRNRNRRK